jgi:hypothetical protein
MFIVTFRSNSVAYVIDFASPDGLKALDAARSVLGPQIDYIARPASNFCRFEVCCDVTESQARRAFCTSGVFGESRQATVTVPPESLTKFVQVSWGFMPGSDSRAECTPIIACDRIVEAWINDGAPLEWSPAASTTDNDTANR